MWQETRLMRAELQKQNNELKKMNKCSFKDRCVCTCGERSLWQNERRQSLKLGYLKKKPGRLLETDGCEGSEVKFRKYTITTLFWVTRHGHSGILCLCLQGISVASALVCIWESKGDCVVRGEGWARGHSYMICGCRVQVQQPRPAGLECSSAAQTAETLSAAHFTQLFHHLGTVHVKYK